MKVKFTQSATSFLKIALPLFLFMVAFSYCKKEEKALDREKFLGTYDVNENCASGNYTYSVIITESSVNTTDVIVNNIGDFGYNYTGTVSGNNLSINGTQQGLSITGTGTINGNALTIIYSASGAFDDNCTATAIKR
jgi:hypothetical protein